MNYNLISIKNNSIIKKNIEQYYPYYDGCVVLYLSNLNNKHICNFFYYNYKTNKKENIDKIYNYSIMSFINFDKYIIFKACDENNNIGIYYKKIGENVVESICTESETYTVGGFNVYNSNVYVCTEDKIVLFDIISKNKEIISNNGAKECYIVDKQYIYYINFSNNLYRLDLKTKIAKKII